MCHDGTALESQCNHSQFPRHDEDNDFDNNDNGDDDQNHHHTTIDYDCKYNNTRYCCDSTRGGVII